MEMVLAGLATWLITELAKKLNISATYVSLWLAFIGGTIYYVAVNYYQLERKEVVTFVTGVYWASQVIYNIIKKLTPENKA
jgi:hypothetical protein